MPTIWYFTFFNALLQDLGLANKENIIDRNKIQREISKFNKNVAETHMKDIRETIEMSECIGPYFDGKRDNTKTFELNDETMQNHPRLKTEEGLKPLILQEIFIKNW